MNSASLSQLILVSGTESLSKRLKVKKGAIAVLTEYKARLAQLQVELAVALQTVAEFTAEKANLIVREVEDSMKA